MHFFGAHALKYGVAMRGGVEDCAEWLNVEAIPGKWSLALLEREVAQLLEEGKLGSKAVACACVSLVVVVVVVVAVGCYWLGVAGDVDGFVAGTGVFLKKKAHGPTVHRLEFEGLWAVAKSPFTAQDSQNLLL